jgi:hypothetical protein
VVCNGCSFRLLEIAECNLVSSCASHFLETFGVGDIFTLAGLLRDWIANGIPAETEETVANLIVILEIAASDVDVFSHRAASFLSDLAASITAFQTVLASVSDAHYMLKLPSHEIVTLSGQILPPSDLVLFLKVARAERKNYVSQISASMTLSFIGSLVAALLHCEVVCLDVNQMHDLMTPATFISDEITYIWLKLCAAHVAEFAFVDAYQMTQFLDSPIEHHMYAPLQRVVNCGEGLICFNTTAAGSHFVAAHVIVATHEVHVYDSLPTGCLEQRSYYNRVIRIASYFSLAQPFRIVDMQARRQVQVDCCVFALSNLWSLAQRIDPLTNNDLPSGNNLAIEWRLGVARDICWGSNPFDIATHSQHFRK